MATAYNAVYKRFNNYDWDIFYFATLATQVAETTERKFVTAAQQTALTTYLVTYNVANKLVKLDTGGKVDNSLMPFSIADYLTKASPTFTSDLSGSGDVKINVDKKFILNNGTNTSYIFESSDGSIYLARLGTNKLVFGAANMSVNNQTIQDVNTPTLNKDATNKAYVDNLFSQGVRPVTAVKCATTANVTLSGFTIHDGYTLVAADRILVWKQTVVADNGIYTTGALATDAWAKVTADSTIGALTFIEFGATYNDWMFYCQSTNTWVEHSKTDTYKAKAAGGLVKDSNNEFYIAGSGVVNDMLAGSINWGKLINTAANEDQIWTDLGVVETAAGLQSHMGRIYSALRLLRGTADYNTNNAETIAGAYDLAEVKNRSYIGNIDPSTSGYVTGDLYFQYA